MSDLIQATSRGVKGTLSDGTVRFMVEVDPAYANDAFALFGMPGSPIVIARLTQEAATASQQAETVAGHTSAPTSDEKPNGGDLARLAGQFCQQEKFQIWMCANDADDAAKIVREICVIDSRAELDHNEMAANRFHEIIRKPYAEWLRTDGREVAA